MRHVRSITAQAFEREDGLWDIEARLTDTKPRPIVLASGTRAAGEPVHDLWLRVTVDTALNIVDAAAASDAVPYPGHCDSFSDAYKQLIGLNLLALQQHRAQACGSVGGTDQGHAARRKKRMQVSDGHGPMQLCLAA